MRDLLFIAVEHERGLFAGEKAGSDHAFAFLAPARMIDIRVYVCVEAILVRCKFVPKRRVLLLLIGKSGSKPLISLAWLHYNKQPAQHAGALALPLCSLPDA